jgi:uncharacterized protein YkuJ
MTTNEMIIFILASLLVILSLFNVYFFLLKYSKDKADRKFNLKGNNHKIDNSEANRRRTFRVDFTNDIKKCSFEVKQIGNKDADKFKKSDVIVADISCTGMRVLSEKDIPVRSKAKVNVSFDLEEENFELEGMIVRKIETKNDPLISYGIDFINVTTLTENRLIKILMFIDAARKRAQRKRQQLINQKSLVEK